MEYTHLWGLEKQDTFEELTEEVKGSSDGERCSEGGGGRKADQEILC